MPNALRALGRRAAYPAILGGAVLATWALLPHLRAEWVLAGVPVAAAAALLVAELLLPYRAQWAQTKGDTGLDLIYLGLNILGGIVFMPAMALIAAAALWLSRQVDAQLWPDAWPIAAQVVLALLIYELGSYAFHSACHRTILWRLHAVHHSVERLYWLNAFRSHPLDYFCAVLTTSGPLLLLGVSEEAFAYVTILGVVNTMFQHANVDTETGWLDWIFVTPRIHRWHHSTRMEEQQRNLSAVVLVWDLVFRTRLCPEELPPDVVGAGHEGYPQTFLAQMRSPFEGALWREG
jgi:sterol desaturase/sphingolipid hydroxylase (fatty acid hydroxylase superfamily)